MPDNRNGNTIQARRQWRRRGFPVQGSDDGRPQNPPGSEERHGRGRPRQRRHIATCRWLCSLKTVGHVSFDSMACVFERHFG
jgi:hypothetical protein